MGSFRSAQPDRKQSLEAHERRDEFPRNSGPGGAMKKPAIGFAVVFVLTCVHLWILANAAGVPAQQIAVKDLKTLEIPGKVVAVIWTVRPERCTLQIAFPTAGQIAQATGAYPTPDSHRPAVQAWLLRSDGSAIQSIGRTEPGANAKNIRQPFGVEVLIAFPRLANTEAVAVALRVDDVYLIERLAP